MQYLLMIYSDEKAYGARSPEEVRDTVEQLRRRVPDAVWNDLRAEGLLAPDTPLPVGTPIGELTPPKEPS